MPIRGEFFQNPGGGGAFYDYQIPHSLRMSKASSSYLRRTQGTPSSTTTFTYSLWVKRHGFPGAAAANNFFITLGNSGSQYVFISFQASGAAAGPDVLVADWQTSPGSSWTSARFQDMASWNHFVFRMDSTQSASADRMRWYHNGTQLTFNQYNVPSQNGAWSQIGSGNYIGHGYVSWTSGADVYLAEVHFCDGQSYAPTQFAEEKQGVWIPKDPSGTVYGNNGYYLAFQDATALGDDSSGNNNDLSTSGLAADHQVTDSPTNQVGD